MWQGGEALVLRASSNMHRIGSLGVLLCFILSTNANSTIIISFPKNIVPESRTPSRVFGGVIAREQLLPYTVFVPILLGEYLTSCTASLVKADKVLLAAHCVSENVDRPSTVLAVAGKHNLTDYVEFRLRTSFSEEVKEETYGIQERQVERILLSEQFSGLETLEHDIAILLLKKPFELSNNIRLIPIATGKLKEAKKCTIMGWGLTEGNTVSSILLFSPSAIAVTLENCKHKKSGPFLCMEKTQSGICQGDSGSPLVCDGKVYGVASHIIAPMKDARCGSGLEEVYAQVFDDFSWITETVGDVTDEKMTGMEYQKALAPNLIADAAILNFISISFINLF